MNFLRYLFLCIGILLFSINFLSISDKQKKEFHQHETKKKIDLLDYAPGYPTYSVLGIDQLKYFPRPRFKPDIYFHRNFSWYDFRYMAYDYSKVTKGKSGIFDYPSFDKNEHSEAAVQMNCEMVKNWNYYYNIPTPTYYSDKISNSQTWAGNIISYANKHPEIPICAYIFWPGITPSTFGYPSNTAYIKTAEAIDPCKNKGIYPSIEIDGIVQQFLYRQY